MCWQGKLFDEKYKNLEDKNMKTFYIGVGYLSKMGEKIRVAPDIKTVLAQLQYNVFENPKQKSAIVEIGEKSGKNIKYKFYHFIKTDYGNSVMITDDNNNEINIYGKNRKNFKIYPKKYEMMPYKEPSKKEHEFTKSGQGKLFDKKYKNLSDKKLMSDDMKAGLALGGLVLLLGGIYFYKKNKNI